MPQKKLFVASVSIGLMVYAETLEEARDLAESYCLEEIGNMPPTADAFIVSDATTSRRRVYADGWGDSDYPYGCDSDDDVDPKTVGDIFDLLGIK